MKVLTTKGEIEFSDLDVHDIIETADNHRKISTEYYYLGELVKRSVWVDLMRPFDLTSDQGNING